MVPRVFLLFMGCMQLHDTSLTIYMQLGVIWFVIASASSKAIIWVCFLVEHSSLLHRLFTLMPLKLRMLFVLFHYVVVGRTFKVIYLICNHLFIWIYRVNSYLLVLKLRSVVSYSIILAWLHGLLSLSLIILIPTLIAALRGSILVQMIHI